MKTKITRNLPNDAYEAATNANAPSALNPFVTEVDAAVSAASLILYPTTAASVIPTYNHLVNSLTDPDYDDPAVDLSTGAITGVAQLIASLASDEGVISGNPGTVNVNTIGNIRRVSGSGTATFYFEIYHRDNLGTETLLGTSNTTYDATSAVYEQFFASALITGITFGPTDRVVTKWYANRVPGASDPTYEIQIGGATPVKVTFPVPLSSLPTTNSFETVGKSADIGFTWGTNDVVADSPTDTLKLVEGTNITIETDDVNDGVRISSTGASAHVIEDEGTPLTQRPTLDFQGAGVTVTDDAGNNQTVVTIPGGGGGGSVWTPPKLGLEDITRGNTAPLLLSGTTGVRYVYFTDSTGGPGGVTDPRIEFTAYLGQDDGNDYDGSALSFRIHYQLFNTIPGVGTDNVRWSPQIYFIREGNDNINTAAVLGNPVDMNVLGKTPNLGYSEIITPQFNTGSPTGVRAIKVILRRLNSDAADTYPNDVDFLGIEIIN